MAAAHTLACELAMCADLGSAADTASPMMCTPGTTFAGVRQALETEDDQTLAALFPKRASGAAFPQQMGGGRLEITFPDGLRPIDATLDLANAVVTVRIARHEDDPAPRLLRLRRRSARLPCRLRQSRAWSRGW